MTADADLRSRVFVSCGQAGKDEVDTARWLAKMLEDRGYQVYVARNQTSLEGLKEAVYPQLTEAEYLLFVDFPRDELADGTHRGSLFSHQELAVAAYLQTPYIGFRHSSVRREGVSQFLLSNMPEFENSIELPQLLEDALARRPDWNPRWRKMLRLTRPDSNEADDLITGPGTWKGPVNERVKFYHIEVENLHQSKMALGCVAYVERIADSVTGEALDFRSAELKWAGTSLPVVPIPARSTRQLDACRIYAMEPEVVKFVSFADSDRHMSPIGGRGTDVGYVVLSENFPPARCVLRIEPGQETEGAKVRQLEAMPAADATQTAAS